LDLAKESAGGYDYRLPLGGTSGILIAASSFAFKL
jgi:hypothetical protein